MVRRYWPFCRTPGLRAYRERSGVARAQLFSAGLHRATGGSGRPGLRPYGFGCEFSLSSNIPAAATHACVDSFSAHLMKMELSPRRMRKMAALV